MSQGIEITPSLQLGLELIDKLENGKLRGLVNHICSSLQLGNNNGKLFSQNEEDRLLLSLDVNKKTLDAILATIKLIYLQAAYAVVKPCVIEQFIEQYFPMSKDKAAIFVDAWNLRAKGIVECLRRKSLFPDQIDDIGWESKIQSSSSALSQQALPVVWLKLGLSGQQKATDLLVEMDKNNLTDIYNKLEIIQRQLDLLEWVPEKNAV